jgi:hypothetical protein
MIFNYLDYPDEKEWNEIVKNSPVLKKLHLKINSDIKYDNDVFNPLYDFEFEIWLRQINNRLFNIYMTYIFLMHYFNKGIPDDKHSDSRGKNNKTVRFLPHSGEKSYWIKYLFYYYVEVLYFQAFSVWDSIHHLINVYYQMDIEPRLGFNENVMKKLKDKNIILHKLLKKQKENEVFEKAHRLRRDFTHNFLPCRFGFVIGRENKEDKKVKETHLGIKIPKSKEFQTNIYQFLELLSTTLEEIKINLER